MTRSIIICGAITSLLAIPLVAKAHSRLFAKVQMTVVSSAGVAIAEIRSVWRYEPKSSAAIREEFDLDGDGSLDDAERGAIVRTVREMGSPFTARVHLVQNGRGVSLGAPSGVRVDVLGREVMISFSVIPVSPTQSVGRMAVWADDPEQNSVLDFKRDEDIKVSGLAFESCAREIVRPGSDSAPSNQAMATEMFFGNPQARDRVGLTSTRLEIVCPG